MTDALERDCIGVSAHRWTFAVEEGHMALGTETCGTMCRFAFGGMDGDDMEWLVMPEIPVTVAFATECPAYDTDDDGVPTGPAKPMGGYESGSHYIAHGTRCDCNWWPVVRIVR